MFRDRKSYFFFFILAFFHWFMIIQSQKYSYCCFSTIYLTHIQSCVEHKSSWSFGTEISCQSDIVSFHHPPDSTPNLSPNNPKGKSGKSQFMGHVSQSLVLSGANKPLSARRLVSLLCTSSKLEIDFCLELKGLQPFHCFSSVCVCISVCVFVCIHVCACSSMCICSRPQNVLRISLVFFVCLYSFVDAISVIEFGLFAACGCPSVKGDFCPPQNAALWLSSPALMATCANKKDSCSCLAAALQPPLPLRWMVILLRLNGFQGFLRKRQQWTTPSRHPVFQEIQSTLPLGLYQKVFHPSNLRHAKSDWHHTLSQRAIRASHHPHSLW